MIAVVPLVLLAALSSLPPIPSSAPCAASPGDRDYHVRTLEAGVRDWIRFGATRSRTFDTLLDRLGASDLIVYVETVARIPAGRAGQLSFVASTPEFRYLRVQLLRGGTRAEMVSMLGHELQHAVEVSEAPCVRDSRGLAALYDEIGDGARSGRYDSEPARLAGERVREELARPADVSRSQ